MALCAGSLLAQDTTSIPGHLKNKHQFGLRLGGWVNTGELPPARQIDESGIELETSINDGSFYLEFFGAYSISPGLVGELSLGIVNRGSVNVYEPGYGSDIGNLLIYPILAQLRFYPFSDRGTIHPFVGAGGGIYYGRQDVQFVSSLTYDYDYYDFDGESEVDFSYVLSAGTDITLSNNIALEAGMRYMPVEFSDRLVTIQDYKAYTITVGVKWLQPLDRE